MLKFEVLDEEVGCFDFFGLGREQLVKAQLEHLDAVFQRLRVEVLAELEFVELAIY